MSERRKVSIVYDGECPFCAGYVRLARFRVAFGEIELINARAPQRPLNEIFDVSQIDLDQGMVVRIGGAVYHGSDAMNVMALASTRSGWFNRLVAFCFSNAIVARLLYPFCRAARRLALWVKGAPLIGHK